MNSYDKAKKISQDFIYDTQPEPGEHYVYAFLGSVVEVSLLFEKIDGHLHQSDWSFVIDQFKTDEICYIGEGVGSRITSDEQRKVTVKNSNRVIIANNLSRESSYQLEKLLIQSFERAANPANTGILANIADGCPAPRHTITTSKRLVLRDPERPENVDARKRGAKTVSKPIVLCDFEKNIIATGSATELANIIDVPASYICEVTRERIGRRSFSAPHIPHRIYACYQEDYQSFIPKRSRRRRRGVEHRCLVGISKDGLKTVQGTASEISKKLEFPSSSGIHTAANPDYPHVRSYRGWTFTYA